MENSASEVSFKNIIKISGAYIAWVIGSGFATGQEVLQFFSSYGSMSFAAAGINLAGFILIGYFLMRTGFENRNNREFDHFKYYCGKKTGFVYSWIINITVLFLIPVLISGGGATLNEYYGIPKPFGSAVIAVAVFVIYLVGFEKMIAVISKSSPVIIVFTLTVGIVNLIKCGGNGALIKDCDVIFKSYKAAPTWWLSGLLYIGLNFFSGSSYFTQLGTSANSVKELKYGAVAGSLMLIMSVTVMSTAIMLNADALVGSDIPVLYLAKNVSEFFGAIFSAVLVLGIFSACSVMMWSVCSNLSAKTHKNVLTALAVAVFGYVVSLFSFGSLIGTVYPVIGYVGFVYLACVVIKGFNIRKI